MKKIILIICLLAFYIGKLEAQSYISQYDYLRSYRGKGTVDTLDWAKIKITYSLDYMPDSLEKGYILKDRKILLIGDKYNHFFSYYVRQQDSVLTADWDRNKNSAPINWEKDILGEGYEIFVNLPEKGKQTVKEFITNLSIYRYMESSDPPTWSIHSDTSTILNYLCTKATTRFRGRDWTVWFCPDIPVDAGPWKLRGLPGLILKVADSRNHYIFECIGMEQLDGKKEPILYGRAANHSSTKCTREEYRKVQKRFYEDHTNMLRIFGFNINVMDNNGEYIDRLPTLDTSLAEKHVSWSTRISKEDLDRKLPYNPIELE
ncbi:MAG: GLPGLI family protein [Tannerella sp.]|nr:GLPGLI family protein [Tannerella sp.]